MEGRRVKRTGRPSKKEADALVGRIAFRVTEAERARIEDAAAAAGTSVSAYARSLVLTARPPRPRPAARADQGRALVELNRAGTNLNQIARALNAGRGVPTDFAETLAELRAAVAKVAAEGAD